MFWRMPRGWRGSLYIRIQAGKTSLSLSDRCHCDQQKPPARLSQTGSTPETRYMFRIQCSSSETFGTYSLSNTTFSSRKLGMVVELLRTWRLLEGAGAFCCEDPDTRNPSNVTGQIQTVVGGLRSMLCIDQCQLIEPLVSKVWFVRIVPLANLTLSREAEPE